MALSVGTFADLISGMTQSANSPITITANIDAKAEGYVYPVDGNSVCSIDLNGHTISNAFFSQKGIFNGKLISSGRLINIYATAPSINLEKVVASVYASGTLTFQNLLQSAVDVTCDGKTVHSSFSTTSSSRLSNVVIRNAIIRSYNYSAFGIPDGRWMAIVFDNCTIGTNASLKVLARISYANNYICFKNTCTFVSDIQASINSGSLICGDGASITETSERYDCIISEANLKNKAYLQKVGFLP